MSSICAFCLSKDRNLSYINNQQLFYVYYALNSEDAQYLKHLQTECLLQVCWECSAKLRNFAVFVRTVEQGVHVLRDYLEHPSEVLPQSLSKLFISEVLTVEGLQLHSDETVTLASPDKVEGFGPDCGVKFELELTQIIKEPLKDPASSIKSEDNFDDDGNYMAIDDLLPYQSEVESRDVADADVADSTEEQGKLKTRAKAKSATKPKRKKRPPSEPKCTVQWVSNEQAQAWYTSEREQERVATPTHTHLCDKCQRGFAGEQELLAHVELRHSEAAGKYTCNMCQYRFTDQNLLKHHIESHYLLYKCKKCSYETRKLSLMQTHSKTEHGGDKAKRRTQEERTKENEKAQKCKRCKNVFANMTSLRKHRAKCSTYKCEHCDKSFKYNPSYYEHLKTHREDAEETLIYCAGCETHFKSAKWYKQHFFKSLKHVTRDAFKHECQHCGMKFLTPRRLREHVGSIHLKKGIYQCEMCPKSYMSKGMFARHRASKHNLGLVNKTRDKICDVCGKAFTSNHLLNNHMRSHTGEKPFQCSFCPATFAQSGTLYTHTKVVHNKRISKQGATDTERYRCSVCNKEFGTDAKRRAHFDYYHLKNSKFACSVCDKNFISSTSLKNHNATRHGLATSRSYSCEHCGKKFTTASARCQHLKTHSSERSLQCRACEATFRNTGALYMHYKLKHLKLKRGDRVRIKNLCKSAEEIIVNRDP